MGTKELYRMERGTGATDELLLYMKCFEKNGTLRPFENLVWLQQQNILKTSMINYAYDKYDGIAAIYTALPSRFIMLHNKVLAMQSLDTLTDSDHRGKGLFTKLALSLDEKAEQEGYNFVYGFPNANSAPGYFNKLGWNSFGQLPFLIKPLKLEYFLRKIFRKKNDNNSEESIIKAPAADQIVIDEQNAIKKIVLFSEEYDAFWVMVSYTLLLVTDRNAEYMNWRFVTKPGEFYYRYGFYRQNKLVAVIIFTLKIKHDGIIGYIMELLFLPGNERAASKLLKFAKKFMRSQKTDVILSWCFPHSFNFKIYRTEGFFKLLEKLRPVKLFFGVKAFRKDIEPTINNLNNWYISYSDSDTV